MTTQTDQDKRNALAAFLKIDVADVLDASWHEDFYSTGGLGEYRVLTDDEADEAVEEYIIETLWAFNPEFLTHYVLDGQVGPEELKCIIGDRCEDANPILLALVGNNLPELIEGAVAADGRGIFLAGYDFEENESEDGTFYIYRTN